MSTVNLRLKTITKYKVVLPKLYNLLKNSELVNINTFYKENQVTNSLGTLLVKLKYLSKINYTWKWVGEYPNDRVVMEILSELLMYNASNRKVRASKSLMSLTKTDRTYETDYIILKKKYDKLLNEYYRIKRKYEIPSNPNQTRINFGEEDVVVEDVVVEDKLTLVGDDIKTIRFINKSIDVYGDKYLYGKTKFTNSLEKLTITCPKHGDFLKRANSFLSGFGCNECAKEDRVKQISIKNEGLKTLVEYPNNFDEKEFQEIMNSFKNK